LPLKPETAISEGYGPPAALSFEAIDVALVNAAGVQEAVAVAVAVLVAVFVGVDVFVAVAVFVEVGENSGVFVAVGAGPHSPIVTLSTRQPEPEPLVSVPILHLKTTFCPRAAGGRSTVDEMKPLDVLPHAARPASGFEQHELTVEL
jgi:hypothetical protein